MCVTHDGRVTALLAIASYTGLAVRLRLAVSRSDTSTGEAQNVATTFVQGRAFADVYFVGADLTVHPPTTMPLLSGVVYRTLGVNSPSSETILQVMAFIVLGATYSLFAWPLATLGNAEAGLISAIVFLYVVPLFLGQETLDFLCWEGGLACMAGIIAFTCTVILAAERLPLTPRRISSIAAMFLTSVALGYAAGSAYGLALILRYPFKACAFVPSVAVAATTLVLSPPRIRNYFAFEKTGAHRRNALLKLSIANNDMVARAYTQEAFNGSMVQMHPTFTKCSVADSARRGGEIAYMDHLSLECSYAVTSFLWS